MPLSFPTEIVIKIIDQVQVKDLYACTLVNHQFHAVANPYLWQSFGIENAAQFKQLMTGLKETRPPMGRCARHVHLDGFVTNRQLVAFASHTPLLQDLLLEDASHITDKGFKQLPNRCPHLHYLAVCQSPITHVSIRALAQHCHQLTTLRLEECPGLSAATFATLAHGCPRLRELCLDVGGMNEFNLAPYGGTGLFNQEIAHECALNLADLHHLTSLTIRESLPAFSQHVLVTPDRHGQPAWPNLVEFSLGACIGVSDPEAIRFIDAHVLLFSFTLELSHVSDDTLLAIARRLPLIMFVGLPFNNTVTANGLRRLAYECDDLVHIDLYGSGILAEEFPEAGSDCEDDEDDDDDQGHDFKMLDHLDSDAIQEIKWVGLAVNSDLDDMDEEQDNDGDLDFDNDDNDGDDHDEILMEMEQEEVAQGLMFMLLHGVFGQMQLDDEHDQDDRATANAQRRGRRQRRRQQQ